MEGSSGSIPTKRPHLSDEVKPSVSWSQDVWIEFLNKECSIKEERAHQIAPKLVDEDFNTGRFSSFMSEWQNNANVCVVLLQGIGFKNMEIPSFVHALGRHIAETSGTQPKTDFPADDKLCMEILKRCAKYMFYSNFSCVGFGFGKEGKGPIYEESYFVLTSISQHFAVTAAHCLQTNIPKSKQKYRRQAEEGDKFLIKSCVDNTEYIVQVHEICTKMDYALVAMVEDREFPFMLWRPIGYESAGMSAICLGLPSFDKKITTTGEQTTTEGNLTTEVSVKPTELVPYKTRISAVGVPEPYLITVNCGTQHGFSGGGLFDLVHGRECLIGICIRARKAPPQYNEFRKRAGYRSVAYFLAAPHFTARIPEHWSPTVQKRGVVRSKTSPPDQIKR